MDHDRDTRRRRGEATVPEPALRPEKAAAAPVTPRAVLLGAVLVALLGAINPYLAIVLGVWGVGWGSLLSSTVCVLFLLVAANTLVARLLPRRALSRGELLVIYGMLIVSVGMATQGGIPYLVSITPFTFYMATPENGWAHNIWPHVPPFLQLSQPQYVTWYWEGMPAGARVPWAAWRAPMFAWGSFAFALLIAMFSLEALLRKDWIERQRLTFPLVEVPLSLTGHEARPTLAGSILGNRTFWCGFSIPALFVVLEWFHRFSPTVPSPQLFDIDVGRNFAGMGLPWSVLATHANGLRVSIVFPIIGITCLLPGEVSLSLWLFYVLFRVQQLVWASFGIADQGGTVVSAISPTRFMIFQEAGGFIALTAVMLYQSRQSLRAAWRGLIGGGAGPADLYAPMSERAALAVFLAANAFMLWWVLRAGMSWWSFALLMGMYYAVLIGASRLVAAGGLVFTDTGFFPRPVVVRTLGALPIGPTSLTMYAYLSTIFMYDPMNLAMPQMMNSFKLVRSAQLRGRTFTLAAVIAVAAILTFGISAFIATLNKYGANTAAWNQRDYPNWGIGELEASLRDPERADNWLRLAVATGAGVTLLLVWLSSSVAWWPVNPVGFLIAGSWESNRQLWLNCFIAWVISTLVRRYGGMRLFRQLHPAFLGLVLGDYLPRGLLDITWAVLRATGTVR
jgi:hypothetical protein